ncbi:hypothetical protein, partial [Sinorhizobium meliloti]|uniref:hypothetical protein n=1 Tax=Rhizobium meliloti TaxID=382 RepID=UPI001AEC9382
MAVGLATPLSRDAGTDSDCGIKLLQKVARGRPRLSIDPHGGQAPTMQCVEGCLRSLADRARAAADLLDFAGKLFGCL